MSLPKLSGSESVEVRKLDLPILSEIFGRIPYGRVILALYDPDSQYSSVMINIAAGHLKNGGDLLYLSSSAPTVEIRQQFNDLGVNIAKYEARDSAVLFDLYSGLMGVKSSEKYQYTASNLNERSITIGQSAPQWPPGTLVFVESFSSLAGDQDKVFAKFSRKVMGVWRAQGTVMILGLAVDIHTSEFYQEMKLASDGVFELKLKEYHGEVINTIRARSMKGQSSDTRWRQILFDSKMKATLRLLEK
jgi:KaiC/GvpD/RAD55 family RecA-like ATPase